ncbi:hypothetical protein B0I37DRAFT_165044 [Chaetomium sp. MPI-CAGE-AT-0009]|nr:hypothetical protein B0I37DRAFT_165044 [Chaetomium sp. MPI-CAGE-AT-0009]
MEKSAHDAIAPEKGRETVCRLDPPHTHTKAPDDQDSDQGSDSHYYDAPEWPDDPDLHMGKGDEADRHPEPKSASSSLLESLPAELRDQILLSVPDLTTLHSLVRASPVMHAQYRSNRKSILRVCVARELDGFIADAYGCVKSRVGEMMPLRTVEKITAHLEAYRGWLANPTPLANLDGIRSHQARWLSRFHLGVAKPMARRYSAWALQNLARATSPPLQDQGVAETGPTTTEQDIVLSRSEEIRIYRALYRFHTYCQLFGVNQCDRNLNMEFHEVNALFFGLFEPWEVDAVICVDGFLRQRYGEIFDQIQDDLHAANPEYDLGNDNVHAGSLYVRTQRQGIMHGTVSRGLGVADKILKMDSHETLIAKIQKYLVLSCFQDDPIPLTTTWPVQRQRRAAALSARDEAEQRKDPMEFAGDAVPPDGPPLGWVLLWNGTYVNIYGDHVPPAVQNWGYVMWDEHRWDERGARALVVKQWETESQRIAEIEHCYGWCPSGF